MVGKSGLTDGVVKSTMEVLNLHELVKVSLPAEGSQQKKALVKNLSMQTGAHVIQEIGHVAVLFRQKKNDSAFTLPKKTEAD